jgi:CheY-like chemotaxis protein
MSDTSTTFHTDRAGSFKAPADGSDSRDSVDTARTVLVADHDPVHRALVAEMLAGEGHTILLASDGEEALARIEAGGVDLLIAAVSMPRISGLELLQAMREIDARPRTIVIAPGMTEMDGLYLKAAGAMGASCGHTWPLTPSVFFRDVSNLLERRSV